MLELILIAILYIWTIIIFVLFKHITDNTSEILHTLNYDLFQLKKEMKKEERRITCTHCDSDFDGVLGGYKK